MSVNLTAEEMKSPLYKYFERDIVDAPTSIYDDASNKPLTPERSEERRVGKEC